jgi:hypothetical protein
MKKFHIIGLAAFAVFALSAFMASSAFAANPEWLIDGAAVAAGTSTETTGDLVLSDRGAAGEPAMLCEGILDGTVGPAGVDEITEVLNTAGVKVTSVLGGSPVLLCPSVRTCQGESEMFPIGLPWKTQLELSGANVIDLTSATKIAYEIVCTILGVKVTDECTQSTAAGIVENMLGETPPDVLVNFGEQTGNCTVGGAGKGSIEGFGLIFALEGLSLTVSGDEVVE